MDIRKAPTKVDDSSGFRFLGVDDDELVSITPDNLMKTTPEYLKIRNNDTSISPNTDFAEVAEWSDGNTSNEDRIGYFVSVSKIKSGITMTKATSTSDVRGVTIDRPAFAANASKDKYDENNNLLKQYNYVAFTGFATVIDNGTCTVNERCVSDDNGCAIPSDNTMGYQVIERVDSNKVLILVESNADMLNRIKRDIIETNNNVNAEIERAKSAEKSNADAISAETERATTAESGITESLNAEIERAKSAEKSNADAIAKETARAKDAENTKAPLVSPTLTGTPKAPTASSGTNTTQIATTAFVQTAVSNHNTSTTAHSDIRDLISDLTTRLNALADSDDTTLDQLSEIVAYIKSNRTLIESITTDKVNVSDIIDNLTSTASDKPLSANQGKVLNDLINALSSVVDTKIDTINGDTYIGTSKSGTTGTITHKDVTRTNTTSTASPSHGGTFTAVKTVTSDAKGHVTGVDTETVTLPTYTALKNPNAISINGKSYDGSSAVDVGTIGAAYGGTGKTSLNDSANALINSLSTGDATPSDADYYVAQYAGGGTTTTTYHRRPLSALWNYIKSKLATVATSGSYNDLTNKPTIPTNNNQLTNGAGYITSSGTAKTISDTLPISKGGTGATTAKSAEYNILNGVIEETGNIGDDTQLVYVYQNPSATQGVLHFRKLSKLWGYIKSKLATVATSGSYNDLSNKPTIGNGTVTIKQAGTSKGTFTMNQSSNTTIELTDYDVATSSALGLVKSGTDITVDSSGNVSVNDDSHNHVISNVDGLQSALDRKSATGHTHDDRYYTETEIDSKLNTKLNTSLKGSANGLAELDSTGKVPSSQLPSFVDDVVEGYLSGGKFYKESAHTTEISGESGKIYIDLSTEKTYRWSGSAFVVISETLALGETSSTAYRGDRGKIAYDHSQVSHAPSNAEVNQNAFSNVTVGSTTIAAISKTDTLTLEAGSNVTLTPDTTNDKITISSAHPTITKSTDSTSTASPSAGETFTAVDSVTRDGNGHVTKVNTKTVTLPNTSVAVDSALSSTSTNPVQNKIVNEALSEISDALSNFVHTSYGAFDVDALFDNGIYGIQNGSNCPNVANYGTLLVMSYRKASENAKPDFCTQIFLPNGDDTKDPNCMYYRTSLDSTWNEWVEVAKSSDLSNYLPTQFDLKGRNTISINDDTTSNWGAQKNSVHFYTDEGNLNGKPSIYGLMFNMSIGSEEVAQIWHVQPTGALYHRGGNANTFGSWREVLDSSNYSSYALPLSGGTISGSLNVGGKVAFNTDNEGGNIRWWSPEGVQWEFDCFNENFRLFNYNSFKDFVITRDEGDVHLPNNLILEASAPILKLNDLYINRNGGSNCETHIYGYTASYPHIMLRQYTNAFQFLPHTNYEINNGSHIGHSQYRFGEGYFTDLYNSSGAITTSDRNKKHDIEEISDDFSEKIVDGLIPSSFKFNDGSSGRTHFGIIAQDLEELLGTLEISTTDFAPLVKEYPDKEVEIENPDYDENDENSQKYIKKLEKDYDAEPIYNVRYEEFIMILVKYCQGLKKKELSLETRMSELENRLNVFENILN